MFLISPHQFKHLTQPETSIRQTAEDDLDNKMRAILDEPGMTSYEKIKKYDALLQRYLTLIKQGQIEEPRMIVTLQRDRLNDPVPESDSGETSRVHEADQLELDSTASEVLKILPKRDRRNGEYILKKLSERNGWTSKGEFVYQGHAVKGSHLIDLLKNLLLPFKRKSPDLQPTGWISFLNTLNELNIPISSVNNPQAREQYRRLKTEPTGMEKTPSVKPKKKIILSPHFLRPEQGELDEAADGRNSRRRTKPPRWFTFSS